jgi:hypothetical protein
MVEELAIYTKRVMAIVSLLQVKKVGNQTGAKTKYTSCSCSFISRKNL